MQCALCDRSHCRQPARNFSNIQDEVHVACEYKFRIVATRDITLNVTRESTQISCGGGGAQAVIFPPFDDEDASRHAKF